MALRGIGDAGKNILSLEKGPRGVDPVISIVVAQPHEPLSSPPPLPSLPRQLPLNCPASRLFRDSKGFALRIERAGGTLKSVLAPSSEAFGWSQIGGKLKISSAEEKQKT